MRWSVAILLCLLAPAAHAARPEWSGELTAPAVQGPFESLRELKNRFDALKCHVPGRFIGSMRRPGAQLCFGSDLSLCVLAQQRSRREVFWFVSLSDRSPIDCDSD